MSRRTLVLVSIASALLASTTVFASRLSGAVTVHTEKCVPTEHMPILGLGAKSHSRMPVMRPSGNYPMPIDRRVPCYLRDTLAALGGR